MLTALHELGAKQRAVLCAERMAALESEPARLRAELVALAPRRDLVRESLRSLRTVLEGAAGNVLASGWLKVLQGLG